LLSPALHFCFGEILVAVVDRLELAAVDGDAGRLEQIELAADLDKPRAHLLDGGPVVLPEIGDGLEVWRKPMQQPHHLEIAARLALETPARMHAVEIAVDVELQVHRRVIGGPAGVSGIDAGEAQSLEIEPVDEGINEANRIALVDPVIEALRQQRRLRSIRPFNEARHPVPRRFSRRIITASDFSHDQGLGRVTTRSGPLERGRAGSIWPESANLRNLFL